MARTKSEEPALTLGNRIYLYGLLARELGCGKQTFLPRVEETLAGDRMTADDLGFENTRALLEALGDCVNLTIFKGGRIYATVVAQPTWDEALAAPADTKADAAAKGGKPWKRKKADKSLKPARPRRVKRAVAEEAPREAADVEQTAAAKTAEPGTEPAASEAVGAPASAAKSDVKAEAPTAPDLKANPAPEHPHSEADATASEATAAAKSPAPEVAAASDSSHGTAAVPHPKSAPETIAEPTSNRSKTAPQASASATEPVSSPAPIANASPVAKPAPAPQPTISLTVTYDPYSGDECETTLEATGIAAPEPAPHAEPASDAKPEAPSTSTPEPQPVRNSQPSTTPAPEKPQSPVEPLEAPQTSVEPHKAPQPSAAEASSTPSPVTPAQRPSDIPSAAALASWPRDFAAEVFCSHELIAELTRLLPLGTSAMPLLAQDYRRARDLDLVRGTRARATFPLRIEHETTTGPILITIRHQRGTGLSWALTKIE